MGSKGNQQLREQRIPKTDADMEKILKLEVDTSKVWFDTRQAFPEFLRGLSFKLGGGRIWVGLEISRGSVFYFAILRPEWRK